LALYPKTYSKDICSRIHKQSKQNANIIIKKQKQKMRTK